MLSFAHRVKSEMCRSVILKSCCAEAELYGMLLFGGRFSESDIRLGVEHAAVNTRAAYLLKRVFSIENQLTSADAYTIYAHYGYEGTRDPALHLNNAFCEDDCCREAFIRGAFLTAGSITDPKRGYHLEISTRHYNLSREFVALLLDMDFTPKTTVRKSVYVVYFKESGMIEDFLTKAGAVTSSLRVMEAKVEKDMRNSINRVVNCDTANITKTVEAAKRQISAINRLQASGRLKGLPAPLRAAAALRLEHPEETLSELAEMGGTSRSGLNHRLKRLVELGEE